MTAAAPTRDWLLAQYATGSLPPAGHMLAACYLELNPEARAGVSRLEAVGGWSLETVAPVGMAAENSAAAVLDRLEAAAATSPSASADGMAQGPCGDIVPPALSACLGAPLAALRWTWRAPGAYDHRIESLEAGGLVVRLLRIEPGRAIPQHTHEGLEATLVLDGAYADSTGRYARGDLEIAGSDLDHKPIAEAGRPCICLAVSEAPLKLTGPVGRLLSALSP